jgi:hypothetical protein
MTVLVDKAFLICSDRVWVVEVHGKGPKGGGIEWTVTFNPDRTVRCGYQYKPPMGYTLEHLIPYEIKEAARRELL